MTKGEEVKPVNDIDGWVDTDSGTQFVRKITENVFEVYDEQGLPSDDSGVLVFKDEVDLSDYTEEELNEQVRAYYQGADDGELSNLNRLKEEYPVGWQQVIAEIIAEQASHDEYVLLEKTGGM